MNHSPNYIFPFQQYGMLEYHEPNSNAAFGSYAGSSSTAGYGFGGGNTNDIFDVPFGQPRLPIHSNRSLIDPAVDQAQEPRQSTNGWSQQNRPQGDNTRSDSEQTQDSDGASPTPSASQAESCGKGCSQREAAVSIVSDLASRHGRGSNCVQVEFGGQAVCERCAVSYAGTMKRTIRAGG